MSNRYDVEYTDTFGGEANYSWVRRAVISMPEPAHYGFDGSSNYAKTNRTANREMMRRAEAKMGLTGVRGRTDHNGHYSEFRPYGMCTVLFVTYKDA